MIGLRPDLVSLGAEIVSTGPQGLPLLQEKGPNAVLSVGPTLGVFTIASSVEASRMLTISEATTLSIFSTITLEASMMQTYEAWIIAGIMAVVVFAVLWIVVDNSYRSLRICQTRT